MAWSATQYAKFLDERTRPARDLLAVVPLEAPREVVDLGCGPGNSTALLAERWPQARVIGLDSDPDMLRAAREAAPAQDFLQADIADWRPETPPDLLYANASLQWLDDHEALFLRLIGLLAPGGVLAAQTPDNLGEPSHFAMRAVAADPRWAERLAEAGERRKPLIPPQRLHELLRPLCPRVEIWRTVYHFELAGIDAIVEWFKGSALRPYLAALEPEERPEFLRLYKEAIAPAYPETEGRTLLAFPRFFFVAQVEGV